MTTSLLLATQHGHCEMDSIDIDPEAVRLSIRVAEVLLPVPLSDLAGFRPLAVLDPYTDVVNSLVIAEKPGTSGMDSAADEEL